jgi:hypothetical protein
MYQDEIISEVWRIRDAYAAENDHDLKEIVADLQRRQLHPHSTLVDRRPDLRPEDKTEATVPKDKAREKA